jgi:predicted ribosome quality control (RQC) complex YloA/Tae2 family protein
MTAVENAQAYFRRYDKARRGAEKIPALLKELQTEKAYLEQLEADLMLAESRPEIDAVRESLAAAGWAPQRRRRAAARQVRGPRRFEVEGFPIFVGRNARQNEQVTFERGGPEDLWLHVRGLPGAHVVIKRGRQTVPETVIQRAAELAAYYSRARHSETQVSVDVTERRFVRRVRGKYPGLVTYRNERTLWVRVMGMREPGRS